MLIKDQIKNRRLELGMSVSELAKRCGVSETSVRFWEDDQSYPGKRAIRSLEEALSIQLDWSEGRHSGRDARAEVQRPPARSAARRALEHQDGELAPDAGRSSTEAAPAANLVQRPTEVRAPSSVGDIELILMVQALPDEAKKPIAALVRQLTHFYTETKK